MPAEPATFRARNGALVSVRRLAEVQVPALQRFNAGISEATRAVFLPHAYDEVTLSRYLHRDRIGADQAYVVEERDDVIGYFFLWDWDDPVPCLGVGLTDAWQGQGLGEQMVRRLIAEAREADREGIELSTVPSNERAFRLYQRLGFEQIGEVDNIAGDGRRVRERRMFLALKPGVRQPEMGREFRPPV